MKDFKLNETIRLSPQESMRQAAEKVRRVCNDTAPASITRETADKLLEDRLNGKEIAEKRQTIEQRMAEEWPRIHEKLNFAAELKKCNPNYDLGTEWKVNCQRCVPTHEMRRRGYDVTAMPRPEADPSRLRYEPFSVWKSPEIIRCPGNGLESIREKMREWGDGARAQVVVSWKHTNSGHTFCAEQVNGKTIFYDPQTGKTDVSAYFRRVEPGATQFCRIDNQDVTEKIMACCKKAT